jgi:hypothetical protein
MTTTEISILKNNLRVNPTIVEHPLFDLLDWLEENRASEQGDPSFFAFLKNPTFWINFARVAWHFVKILILRSK